MGVKTPFCLDARKNGMSGLQKNFKKPGDANSRRDARDGERLKCHHSSPKDKELKAV